MKIMNDKGVLFLSTLMCLLPIGMYLLVFDQLPLQMVQQWGPGNTPNWTMPREWAIFVLPATIALLHIIVYFVTNSTSSKNSATPKMRTFLVWLLPVTSVFINLVVLLANIDESFNVATAIFVFVGLTFIIAGNYLPTTRQNYYIGFRLPWTLKDADNWSKTHRLSGKLLVIGGILFVLCAVLPLPEPALLGVILSLAAILVIVPTIYSFVIYKKS